MGRDALHGYPLYVRFAPALLGALCLAATSSARAQGGHQANQMMWSAQVGGRVAPLGLLGRAALGYRRRLFDRNTLLLKNSHLAASAIVDVTPTYSFIGGQFRFEPLAFIGVWAEYQIGRQFGLLNTVRTFESSLSTLSDREQIDRIKNTPSQGVWSHRMTLGGRLQAKYKWIAARYGVQARKHRINVPETEVAWFNANLDIITPTRGWTLQHNTDLLFELRTGFFLAARYSQITAYHQDRTSPIVIHRLGPAAVWRRPPGRRADSTTWFALVQWNLRHPTRNGNAQSVAMPMITLGWGIQGHWPLGGEQRS